MTMNDTLRAIPLYIDEDAFRARACKGAGLGMFYPNLRSV